MPRRVPQEGHALFESCAGNHLATAQLLLENGADPNGDSNSSDSGYEFVQHKHPYHYHAMQALLSRYGAEVPDWIKDPGDFISNIQAHPEQLQSPWVLFYMLTVEDDTPVDLALDMDPNFPATLAYSTNSK